MLRLLPILIALLSPTMAAAQALTFVAIASGSAEKQADYETFLTRVQPIWERHGMRPIFRADLSNQPDGTFADVALIEVESRAGFQAYLADPAYRLIAPIRFEAVDHLAVLEGPLTVPAPIFEQGTAINILFQRSCTPQTPGARVALVGAIKGVMTDFYGETGCIRFLAADDVPGSGVLAGFAATIR